MTDNEATLSAIDTLADFVLSVGISEFIIDLIKNCLDRAIVQAHDWLLVIDGAPDDVSVKALTKLAREEIVRERNNDNPDITAPEA